MALRFDTLRRAIDALDRSLAVAAIHSRSEDADLVNTLKAGVIQNFEVAYEQCWKFIQRWMRENGPPEDADHPRTRKDLFRLAARHGLIADPLPWFEYSEARNRTAHMYDEDEADSVFEAAGRFLADAKALIAELESRND